LLVTINRDKPMNAVPLLSSQEGAAIWHWFDEEPSMRVTVITGKGGEGFCAGADLLEQRDVDPK
jgi:enoyl-CoA hydratase/carnithine racemase